MWREAKKMLIVTVVICVVLLGGSFAMNSIAKSKTADISAKQTELSTIKNKVSSMSGSRTTENDVSGLSEKRLSADTDAMATVCKSLFSWDAKTYANTRTDIVSKYGSSMSAEFVAALLPVSESVTDGMSVAYKAIEPVIVSASTTSRTYFAKVTIDCSGTERVVNLGFDVNNDGDVSNFVFYGFDA